MDDEIEPHPEGDADPSGPAPEPSGAAIDPEVDALFEDWLAADGSAGGPSPERRPAEGSVPSPPGDRQPTLVDALAGDAEVDTAVLASETGADTAAASASRRFVLFSIAGATYAVLGQFVTEVERVPKITPVPRVPAWLRGVTSLRGEVVSLIDLRILLGLEHASLHNGRLLVVRLLDEEFSAGLVVDEVDQIAAIPEADLHPPASPLEGALAPYLTAVGQVRDRFVAVLDLDALLHSAEIRQFDDRRDAEPAA